LFLIKEIRKFVLLFVW